MLFDYSIPVSQRIKFPLLWERLSCGVRIEDLHEDKYEEAKNHIKEYYVKDDSMLKACNLEQDEKSLENFISLTHYWMQDTQSFIAVEEGTNKIVGVLVCRAVDESTHLKTMSRMAIYEGSTLRKIQRFRLHLHRAVDIFGIYNTPAFFRIYIWSVEPEYRGKGIGKALLQAAIAQTKLFKMKTLMGIFTGIVSQNIAAKFGFQSHYEVLYSQWVEHDEIVFIDPGAGNYSAIVMALKIDIGEEEEKEVQETEDSKEQCESTPQN